MIIKLERKFKLADVINKNNQYFMDNIYRHCKTNIYFVNKKITKMIEEGDKEKYIYYAKMSIGHVNE